MTRSYRKYLKAFLSLDSFNPVWFFFLELQRQKFPLRRGTKIRGSEFTVNVLINQIPIGKVLKIWKYEKAQKPPFKFTATGNFSRLGFFLSPSGNFNLNLHTKRGGAKPVS